MELLLEMRAAASVMTDRPITSFRSICYSILLQGPTTGDLRFILFIDVDYNVAGTSLISRQFKVSIQRVTENNGHLIAFEL